jgi:four helix bundle protein
VQVARRLPFTFAIMAKDFTELVAWQLADELRRLIFEITARPAAARDFRYCDQCKDAARSGPSNIAEGFGRYRHRDFAHFLRIAIGSLKEVQDLLIDGHERGYVTADELARGTRLVVRSKSACAALARWLLASPDPQ